MASLSVIIATYNRAAMLRQAIEAALAQSRPPEEIVVSDDASSDETAAVLAELAALHPRLRVLRRETNSGGIGNWNDAMRRARGEYLALCSDDDRYLPDHLQASAAYLDAHPEAGLVHSSFIDVRETPAGTRIEPRPFRSAAPVTLTRRNLLRYMNRYYNWPVHPSTIVMRRQTWERVGEFDPRYQLTDTDWFARAAESVQILYIPRHGVYSRRHAGNWSNRLGSAYMQREIFEIVETAIGRVYPGAVHRAAWRAVWRSNVRLHLALTLAHRLRSGHKDAALALWHGILHWTGRRSPECLEHWGARGIELLCPAQQTAPPSVSPL